MVDVEGKALLLFVDKLVLGLIPVFSKGFHIDKVPEVVAVLTSPDFLALATGLSGLKAEVEAYQVGDYFDLAGELVQAVPAWIAAAKA